MVAARTIRVLQNGHFTFYPAFTHFFNLPVDRNIGQRRLHVITAESLN